MTRISKAILFLIAISAVFLFYQNTTVITNRAIRISPNHLVTSDLNFRTLDEFNTFNASNCLRGGDEIALQRGVYYRGHLNVKICPNSTGVVTIKDYGAANLHTPYILASHTAASLKLSWQKVVHPAHRPQYLPHATRVKLNANQLTLFRLPVTKKVKQLRISSLRQQIAVYPDKNQFDPTFIKLRGSTEALISSPCANAPTEKADVPVSQYSQWQTCIFAANNANLSPLTEFPSLVVPPELMVISRVKDWNYEGAPLLNYDPTFKRLRLKGNLKTQVSGYSLPSADYGFYLRGSTLLLSVAGEWAYDSASKHVYYLSNSADAPAAHLTELAFENGSAALDSGLNVDVSSSQTDIHISNVNVMTASGDGIRVVAGKSVTITNSTVSGNEESGIKIYSMTGHVKIENSRISSHPVNGIILSKIAGESLVLGNDLLSNGFLSHQTALGYDMNGIRAGTSNLRVVIDNNNIRNSGFAAVSAAAGNHLITISKNRIYDACLWLNDCGAIYINGKGQSRNDSHRIVGNQIYRGKGFLPGSNKVEPSAKAIYLDHAAAGFVVAQNFIEGTDSTNGAIFVHAGNNNNIHDNNISTHYGPAVGMLYNVMACESNQSPAPRPMVNRVTNNTINVDLTNPKKAIYVDDKLYNRPKDVLPARWGNNLTDQQMRLVGQPNRDVNSLCTYATGVVEE